MKKFDLVEVLTGNFSKVVFSFLIFGTFFYSTLLNAQSGKNTPNNQPSKSSTLEITSPTTGEKLEVSLKDFSITTSNTDVRELVKNLGNGWRLPTSHELKLMYEELYLKEIGDFEKGYYTTLECNGGSCWTLNFEDGKSLITDRKQESRPLYGTTTTYFKIRVVRPKTIKN